MKIHFHDLLSQPKMSPLTRKMGEAGCLGTIQMSKEPIKMLDAVK